MMPPLTTTDSPSIELGRLGVELLIQQLDADETNESQVLLPCRLVVRGSSGPCCRERPFHESIVSPSIESVLISQV
jgi:hypothetical protein